MYLHCRSVITRRTRLPPSLSSLLGSRVNHQQCSPPKGGSKPCHNNPIPTPQIPPASPAPRPSTSSILSRSFWTCRSSWKRARINTLRCLVGCTIGDFSALWMLQSFAPDLGMGTIMGLSMASGITTSVMLETYLLWRGADQLSLPMACRTAMGMSMVSMLAMEIAENAVDYHLTGGVVDVGDPRFWLAAGVSVGAGYLAPLPYNYWRLRKYGKACH